MNINFHYFAVKTIASFVGVPEPQAQSLALYSQYVDDYDLYAPFTIADVPAYAQHLARKHTNGKNWTFYPITTGFNRWDTMLRLLLVSNQRAITIPFHFITAQPLKSYPDTTSRELYRTQAASLEKASLIQAMLFAAKCEYLRAPDACNLMRIGILIHIFADTYAHQHFSGFHGWENDSRVTKAIDTHYKKDLTSKFKKWPCDKLPALGHTNVWHTPDETYLEFEIQQKLNKSDKGHHLNLNRSNTQVFAEAAKQIGLFLTDCFRLPQKNDKEWSEFISRLRNGFFITELDSPTLSRKWAAKFPGYEYYYDYKKIINSLIGCNAASSDASSNPTELLHGTEPVDESIEFIAHDDSFFHYNVIAKKIRDCVNGCCTPLHKPMGNEIPRLMEGGDLVI